MVKENIIPKENKAQIEEVQELKETEQEKKIRESYEMEFDSYGNVEVEKSYGPGNEQSKQAATGAAIGTGLVITTAICPPLGGAMTAAYAGSGVGMKVVGEITENEELAKAGEVLGMGASIGTVGGGLVGSSSHACASCKTPSGKEIWKIRK